MTNPRPEAGVEVDELAGASSPIVPPHAYRFQIRRSRGWRKPANGVLVTRPHSPYANPFSVAEYGRAEALRRYEAEAVPRFDIGRLRADLAGRPLGCWCRPDQHCHADLLLRLANDDRIERCMLCPITSCHAWCRGGGR